MNNTNAPATSTETTNPAPTATLSSEASSAYAAFEGNPNGSTFKALRVALKQNQVNFAEKLGISQGLISQVEGGVSPVSKRLKARVAELKAKSSGN